MIQAISAGGAPASILDRISYTGDYLYSLKYMDGVLYHLLTLESSGTLTVTGEIVGDVWMCGAGRPAREQTARWEATAATPPTSLALPWRMGLWP